MADDPEITFHPTLLEGPDNYKTWAAERRAHLRSVNLWTLITNETVRAGSASATPVSPALVSSSDATIEREQSQRDAQDEYVLLYLKAFISKDVFAAIPDAYRITSSTDLWKRLRHECVVRPTFAWRTSLLKALLRLNPSDYPAFTDYVQSFKSHCDKYNAEVIQRGDHDNSIYNEMQVAIFLCNLDDDVYLQVIESVKNDVEAPDLDTLMRTARNIRPFAPPQSGHVEADDDEAADDAISEAEAVEWGSQMEAAQMREEGKQLTAQMDQLKQDLARSQSDATRFQQDEAQSKQEAQQSAAQLQEMRQALARSNEEAVQAQREAIQAKQESARAKQEAIQSKQEAAQSAREALQAKQESTRAQQESSQAKKEALQAKQESTRAQQESSQAKQEALQAKQESTRAQQASCQAKQEALQSQQEAAQSAQEAAQSAQEAADSAQQTTRAEDEALRWSEAAAESDDVAAEMSRVASQLAWAVEEANIEIDRLRDAAADRHNVFRRVRTWLGRRRRG